MIPRAIRRALATAGLAWPLLSAAPPAAASDLPPIGCVQALRRARIDTTAELSAVARRRLEAAAAIPGCELPALSELLQSLFAARAPGSAPDPETEAIGQRLARRLEDPAVAVPPGMFHYLAAASFSAAQDRMVLAALRARRDRSEASGPGLGRAERIELLGAIFDLELDLDQREEAHATLDRLRDLADSDLWRWRALELDFDLGRWDELLAVVGDLRASGVTAPFLDQLELLGLAHLGRYDEVATKLDRLLPAGPPPPGIDASAVPGREGGTGTALPAPEPDPDRAIAVAMAVQAGWALRDAGRDADAERIFRRAYAADPDHFHLREILQQLYAGPEERAAFAAEESERRSRVTNPDALYEEGTQLLAAGDPASAYDLLARAAPAIEGARLGDAPWYNLGLAAYELKRWREAADAFAHAAQVNPERPESHFQRGLALYFLDRCAEAVPALRRALELAPAKYKAHYYLAECLARLGEPADAARERELYHHAVPHR